MRLVCAIVNDLSRKFEVSLNEGERITHGHIPPTACECPFLKHPNKPGVFVGSLSYPARGHQTEDGGGGGERPGRRPPRRGRVLMSSNLASRDVR